MNYMSEYPESQVLPSSEKEEFKLLVVEKKIFDWRIVKFPRLERACTSPIVPDEEKKMGQSAEPAEIVKWNKEFDRLNRSLEFHTDFALKAVAFFYAVVGGVLSVFFGTGGGFRSASIVLLGVPIIISWILGYYFLYGAVIWDDDADYMRRLQYRLGFEKLTKIELLSELLRVFAVLFFVTGALLIVLLIWVLRTG
jgi:hypothetical protein